jgi:hypothetical protein
VPSNRINKDCLLYFLRRTLRAALLTVPGGNQPTLPATLRHRNCMSHQRSFINRIIPWHRLRKSLDALNLILYRSVLLDLADPLMGAVRRRFGRSVSICAVQEALNDTIFGTKPSLSKRRTSGTKRINCSPGCYGPVCAQPKVSQRNCGRRTGLTTPFEVLSAAFGFRSK